jgi:predicted DNA-binding transcriptional regulator
MKFTCSRKLEHPTRLQTCARNVSISHLGLGTHYHNIFSGFPQFILVNVWTLPYNYATTRFLKFLQNVYSHIKVRGRAVKHN